MRFLESLGNLESEYEEPPKRKESWVDFARFDLHKLCESSLNFLSAIFGIFGKFSIDIGENYFRKNVFFETKKFSRKKNVFRFFSENVDFRKIFIENQYKNFRKSWKISIFQNFKIFKILIFLPNFFHWIVDQNVLWSKIFLFFFAKKFWSRKNIFKNIVWK